MGNTNLHKNLLPDQAIMMEIAKNDFDHGTVVMSDEVPVEVVEAS
jgi:hypothetical protein